MQRTLLSITQLHRHRLLHYCLFDHHHHHHHHQLIMKISIQLFLIAISPGCASAEERLLSHRSKRRTQAPTVSSEPTSSSAPSRSHSPSVSSAPSTSSAPSINPTLPMYKEAIVMGALTFNSNTQENEF